jgi:hypothetical protein
MRCLILSFIFWIVSTAAFAEHFFKETEFFSYPMKDSLEGFLKDKGIAFDCELQHRKAVADRFTGVIVFCETKTEWMEPSPGKGLGHHSITRIKSMKQLKKGIIHGTELYVSESEKYFNTYEMGRLISSTVTNKNGKVDKQTFADCIKVVEPKLQIVPTEHRFVGSKKPIACKSYMNEKFFFITTDCKEGDEEKSINGKVFVYDDFGNLETVFTLKEGILQGLAATYKFPYQLAEFDQGLEKKYIAFNVDTCGILPESNPQKRTAKYRSGTFIPVLNHVPAIRPDKVAEYKKEMSSQMGVSILYKPIVFLSSPILVWFAPELYGKSYPTATATYYFSDKYWEGAIGMLSFETKDWMAYGHAFHYTYKKIDDAKLWGMRYSAGVSLVYFLASLQGGVFFEQTKLSQFGIDLCVGTLASVCLGGRVPLKDQVKELESPVQISLKLGL